MSFRATALLLALFAVLGAGVYFFEYRPNPDPSGLDPKLQIWKLDRDSVERIVARSGDQEQVMQKRADGLWYLEPQDVRADYWRISGTLVRLSNMRASRRVTENPRDLATYGLDQPRAALTLRTPDGVDHTLLIGEKSPTEAGYFAKQPENNIIWLVGTFNVEDIERFVKEPAYEPTPVPTATPSPGPEGTPVSTPTPGATPAAAETPTPTATPAAPPGLPTPGVSSTSP
jgi:hypothetical protein